MVKISSAANSWKSGSLIAFALLVPMQAQAHHVMDGQLPVSLLDGLLSGFAHPVIGLDHLAFIIALGLLSLAFGKPRKYWIPAAFVVATLAGTIIHLFSFDLPVAEMLIAGSVVLAGLLLVSRLKLPSYSLFFFASVTGLLHGYAYGESIVGAEAAPLVAYLVGFSLIQYAIALLTMWLASVAISNSQTGSSVRTMRLSGSAVMLVGTAFLYIQLA